MLKLEACAAFHELSPATHSLPAPPRFLFGDCPAALASFFYGRSRLPPSGVFAATGMEVSEGLLLRAEDTLVEAPALNWQVAHVEQAVARYGLPGPQARPRRIEGGCALIVTPGYPIYGHWLVDMLPRLGLLEAAGHDLDSLTYIVADDTPRFGLELLRLAGIGPERLVRLEPGRPVRPDTLLMPTFPHNGRQFMPLMAHATAVLRRRVEARFGPLEIGGYPTSILISRHGVGGRRMENREQYEAMAEAHGFAIVAPETMPMLEQFRLFAGAREILGEYGSALHSSLFSPAGTVVCALRGTQEHPAFIQSGIGDALDQPTGYVLGADREKFGFAVRPDDLRDCLDTVFGPARPRLGPAIAALDTPRATVAPAADRPDPGLMLRSLRQALQSGSLDEANRTGMALLALAPRLPGLAAALSVLFTALGQPREAIRFAIAAVDQAPADAEARAALSALLPAPPAGSAPAAVPDSPVLVDFSAQGSARGMLLDGWSKQEATHTWMIETVSRITLPRLPVLRDCRCVLDASPMQPQARLCIRFNDHEVARMEVASAGRLGFRIPSQVIAAGNPGILAFEHPDCISPLELGRNKDPRRLAFAARSLRLGASASGGV